jgi:hypothetical protein
VRCGLHAIQHEVPSTAARQLSRERIDNDVCRIERLRRISKRGDDETIFPTVAYAIAMRCDRRAYTRFVISHGIQHRVWHRSMFEIVRREPQQCCSGRVCFAISFNISFTIVCNMCFMTRH